MSCCIAIGFFELPGLAGGFLYTMSPECIIAFRAFEMEMLTWERRQAVSFI